MARPSNSIPVAYLRECFAGDLEAGTLTWLRRPREHFSGQHAWATWNTRYAGRAAGSRDDQGYLRGGLKADGKLRPLQVHRIIWALATGAWPSHEIDHKNGVRDDNRLDNLRPATGVENHHNRSKQRNNTSGFLGVSWNERWGNWRAAISIDGRYIFLGYYNNIDDARHAYIEAKCCFHEFQPLPREWVPPPPPVFGAGKRVELRSFIPLSLYRGGRPTFVRRVAYVSDRPPGQDQPPLWRS